MALPLSLQRVSILRLTAYLSRSDIELSAPPQQLEKGRRLQGSITTYIFDLPIATAITLEIH